MMRGTGGESGVKVVKELAPLVLEKVPNSAGMESRYKIYACACCVD